MRTDCHQHLWPDPLIAALRRRTEPPYLEGWVLHTSGEAPYVVDPVSHDARARAAQEAADGTGRVLLSLSSPLGIEHLPPGEAGELIDAWHEGALALGEPFGVWAAACVTEPDPAALRAVLARPGVVGLQLPATALADPAAIETVAPLIDELEAADLPLLVHPGPATACAEDLPSWWPALVPYVAQLHAAWLAWRVSGAARHPRLRIAFVALAGLAPLHHERLVARGGTFGAIDPRVFYETSSYDTRAVDAMTRVVGVDGLVHGSDRPYAVPRDPGLGEAFTHALFTANPAALLTGAPR